MSKLSHSNELTMLEIEYKRTYKTMTKDELANWAKAGRCAEIALGKKVAYDDPLLWWTLTTDLFACFNGETRQ